MHTTMNLWKIMVTTNNISIFSILWRRLQTLQGKHLAKDFVEDFSFTILGNVIIKTSSKTSNISNKGFGKICNKWTL